MKTIKKRIKNIIPENYKYLENVIVYKILKSTYFKQTFEFLNLAKINNKYYLYHNHLNNIENVTNKYSRSKIILDKEVVEFNLSDSEYTKEYENDDNYEIVRFKIDKLFIKEKEFNSLKDIYEINKYILDNHYKEGDKLVLKDRDEANKKINKIIKNNPDLLTIVNGYIGNVLPIYLHFQIEINNINYINYKSINYKSKIDEYKFIDNIIQEIKQINKKIEKLTNILTIFKIEEELDDNEMFLVEKISSLISQEIEENRNDIKFEIVDIQDILKNKNKKTNNLNYDDKEKINNNLSKKYFNLDFIGFSDLFDDYNKKINEAYFNGLNGFSYMKTSFYEIDNNYEYAKAFILLKNKLNDCIGCISLNKNVNNNRNYLKVGTIAISDRYKNENFTDMLYRKSIEIAEENNILIIREKNNLSEDGRKYLSKKDLKFKSKNLITVDNLYSFSDIKGLIVNLLINGSNNINLDKLNNIFKKISVNYEISDELYSDFSLEKLEKEIEKDLNKKIKLKQKIKVD